MGWIYLGLLASIVALVLVRGDRDAKIAIGAITIGSILTFVSYVLVGRTWLLFNDINILIEGSLLSILLWIAMRSRSYWPLIVAALQIMAFLSHFAILFGKGLVSEALGITQGVWAYPQFLIIAGITVRNLQTEKTKK